MSYNCQLALPFHFSPWNFCKVASQDQLLKTVNHRRTVAFPSGSLFFKFFTECCLTCVKSFIYHYNFHQAVSLILSHKANFQKQPAEVSVKKDVFKNFANLTREHLCWSFLLIKLHAYTWRTSANGCFYPFLSFFKGAFWKPKRFFPLIFEV